MTATISALYDGGPSLDPVQVGWFSIAWGTSVRHYWSDGRTELHDVGSTERVYLYGSNLDHLIETLQEIKRLRDERAVTL